MMKYTGHKRCSIFLCYFCVAHSLIVINTSRITLVCVKNTNRSSSEMSNTALQFLMTLKCDTKLWCFLQYQGYLFSSL